jgi:pimeloyl-ACP methyl ester carboxylesterase
MSTTKPAIVFVPGAWHIPDTFHLVIAELQAAGYETKGVNLASVGAETPLEDFRPDVEAVQQVLKPLADEGKDILLVVHSYGGVIGNEAVKGFAKSDREKEGKTGGVSHIYFCCAFALPEGVSLMDALNNKPLPWFQINDAQDTVTPATPIETFYNDVKEPQKYVDMLKPHSYRTFASRVTYPGWQYVPSTYLLCEKDEAIPIQAQKGMVEGAQQAGADMKVETVDASHSPFMSMPEEVARSIRRAAGESA